MGKIQQLFTKDNITIAQLEKLYKDKYGDTFKFKAKNMSLTIEKNAYHLTTIYLQKNADITFITFDEEDVSWWIKMLVKSFGLIGSLILGLIYGKADEFYEDVQSVIKANYSVEVEEVNVGLSAIGDMFKKKS